jgi:hypothetical protein
MPGQIHPLFAEIVRAHFPPFATLALGPDGEDVEVCGLCCGLERVADAHCPRCTTTQDESDAAKSDVAGSVNVTPLEMRTAACDLMAAACELNALAEDADGTEAIAAVYRDSARDWRRCAENFRQIDQSGATAAPNVAA